MHIAINAQLLSEQQSYRGAGVSNYSRHLLASLGAQVADGSTRHRFTAFVNANCGEIAGIQVQRTRWPLQRPLARIIWEQSLLARQLQAVRADLVHGLVNVLPLTTRVPGVVTVHDLSFMRMPESLTVARRTYLARLCQASVQRAAHVIAVSRQTADDVMHYFGIQAHKITVVYNGVATSFVPGDLATTAAFRQAKKLPDRFLLYLGTLEPRKNLELLLKAFARWRNQADGEERQIKLMLAGGKGWFYTEIFRLVKALDLEQSVLFPGFIAEDELPHWYRAAEGFVYPSRFEGFGLPVLEAMACGTPVLCSQASSLLEIVGTSTLTFPAHSAAELSAGLALLTGQPALRAELRAKGLVQAKQFTWHNTAQATIAVYEAARR